MANDYTKITKIIDNGTEKYIDLDPITRDNITDIIKTLQANSTEFEGLLSKADYDKLTALWALYGDGSVHDDDTDTVDTLLEMCKIFDGYPENKNLKNWIDTLNLGAVSQSGYFISSVSQSDGKVSAEKTAFETSVPATNANPSPSATIPPTTQAVRAAIDALNGNITGTPGEGKTLTEFSEAGGIVSATFNSINISSTQINDKANSNYDPTGDGKAKVATSETIKAAIDNLDSTEVGGAKKYIQAIKEENGIITATAADLATSIPPITYASENTAPSVKAVRAAIDAVVPEQPMIYKGGAIITYNENTDKYAVTVTTPSSASNIKKGNTYKITNIPTNDTNFNIGDTLIAEKDDPGTNPQSNWTLIPTGDEPRGTVTSVSATGATNSHITVEGNAITSSGTLTIGVESGYSIVGLPAQAGEYTVHAEQGPGNSGITCTYKPFESVPYSDSVPDGPNSDGLKIVVLTASKAANLVRKRGYLYIITED